MQSLVTRVTENVMVALTTAAVLWLVAHPAMSQGLLDGAVSAVGGTGATWRNCVWAAAGVAGALAAVLFIASWWHTSHAGDSFWEFELHMPSWPVTFAGAALALALSGWGLSLCSGGSWWGLVALSVALWTVLRFVGRVRAGWLRLSAVI